MTPKRMRVYPWIIAATMWAIVAVDFSVPGVRDRLGKVKGTDFLQFYVAGTRVREAQAGLLYDFTAQFEAMQAVAGGDDNVYLPIQTPQAALAFAPLAAFSYTAALAIWLAVSVCLYALTCWLAWRHAPGLRHYRRETLGLCLACPGLYATVLHGQVSAVAALLVTLALLALRHERRFWAGVAFGALAFKPHWTVAAAAIFFVAREWRVLAGIAVAAALQVVVTGAVLGWDVIADYGVVLASLQQHGELLEPRPGHTFRGLFSALLPWGRVALVPYLAAAAVAVAGAAGVWRSGRDLDLRCSAVVLAMILISPHAFEYDLLMLAPVFFMLANWLRTAVVPHASAVSGLLVALFFAPVLAVLPAVIRLQFSVTVMAALLVLIYRSGAGDDRRGLVAGVVEPRLGGFGGRLGRRRLGPAGSS